MFEAYGIKVSRSARRFLRVWRTSHQQPSPLKLDDVFFPFFSPPQLPLLKALVDRLLQGGVEELLQAPADAKDDAGADNTGHVVRRSAKISAAQSTSVGHRV